MFSLSLKIPQVSVSSFLDQLCPQLCEGLNVDEIIGKLKEGENASMTGGGTWRDFFQDTEDQDAAMNSLGRLFNAIMDASGLSNRPFLTFQQDNEIFYASNYASLLRPNAYFAWRNGARVDSHSYWIGIGLPVVFNMYDQDDSDCIRRMLWSLFHCIHQDSSRKFAYGIAFDHTDMRIWFASRSDILVTKSFDLLQDHSVFVRVMLAFAYAQPYELGWDFTVLPDLYSDCALMRGCGNLHGFPIITLLVAKDGDQANHRYQKTRTLANIGQHLMNTYAWESQDSDVKHQCLGSAILLKGRHAQRTRNSKWEGGLMQKARNVSTDPVLHTLLDQHITATIYQGRLSIHEEVDDTPLLKDKFDNMRSLSVCAPSAFQESRAHQRIVMEPNWKPLDSSNSLTHIFAGLAKAAHLLTVLHSFDRLHGDVCPANILLHDDDAVLLDWEKSRVTRALKEEFGLL
ncbi:uncharacterized protein FIBRA_01982 [Fibroporia radiculosa]|uniref:Fungal-type protein kinase domain-containing protein n=1 Tax=Fibroporia radiculosa TaxID=599839 RepID=J4HU69_9APHY|nr:uncharacterized protein FIBRA_01982 [Fibroporia radiculosa]CCL99957.1 predicted protein [Fibroporia radiculosa]